MSTWHTLLAKFQGISCFWNLLFPIPCAWQDIQSISLSMPWHQYGPSSLSVVPRGTYIPWCKTGVSMESLFFPLHPYMETY